MAYFKRYISIILMLVLSSCFSAQSKLRRAKRLIAQAEAAGLEWKSDTVFTTITVEVPTVKIDTLVTVQNWRDTITVTRDRVTTRVVVNPVTKTVYIASKCDSVVITKRVPYTVTREIHVGDSFWRKFGRSVLWLILGLVVGWVGRSLLR